MLSIIIWPVYYTFSLVACQHFLSYLYQSTSTPDTCNERSAKHLYRTVNPLRIPSVELNRDWDSYTPVCILAWFIAVAWWQVIYVILHITVKCVRMDFQLCEELSQYVEQDMHALRLLYRLVYCVIPEWGWKMFYQRQIVAFICKIHGILCYTQVCITYCSDNGFDTNEHTHTHIKQTLKSQVLLLYVMFITPRYLKVFNEWKMKYNAMFFVRVVWQGRPLSEIKWVYPLESWLY